MFWRIVTVALIAALVVVTGAFVSQPDIGPVVAGYGPVAAVHDFIGSITIAVAVLLVLAVVLYLIVASGPRKLALVRAEYESLKSEAEASKTKINLLLADLEQLKANPVKISSDDIEKRLEEIREELDKTDGMIDVAKQIDDDIDWKPHASAARVHLAALATRLETLRELGSVGKAFDELNGQIDQILKRLPPLPSAEVTELKPPAEKASAA